MCGFRFGRKRKLVLAAVHFLNNPATFEIIAAAISTFNQIYILAHDKSSMKMQLGSCCFIDPQVNPAHDLARSRIFHSPNKSIHFLKIKSGTMHLIKTLPIDQFKLKQFEVHTFDERISLYEARTEKKTVSFWSDSFSFEGKCNLQPPHVRGKLFTFPQKAQAWNCEGTNTTFPFLSLSISICSE